MLNQLIYLGSWIVRNSLPHGLLFQLSSAFCRHGFGQSVPLLRWLSQSLEFKYPRKTEISFPPSIILLQLMASSSSLGFIFVLCAIVSIVSHLIVSSQAQNSPQPITDPDQGSLSLSFSIFSVFSDEKVVVLTFLIHDQKPTYIFWFFQSKVKKHYTIHLNLLFCSWIEIIYLYSSLWGSPRSGYKSERFTPTTILYLIDYVFWVYVCVCAQQELWIPYLDNGEFRHHQGHGI